MESNNITPEELWAEQKISSDDVDYAAWSRKRESIQEFSIMSRSCIFTVDVFKEVYDFASENFADIFGFSHQALKTIQQHGDLLEERMHPEDLKQLRKFQIEHGLFIYSLPDEERNDYEQVFQFRMLNAKDQYINVISRHQVVEKDRNGKAWIIMGMMDISPDQMLSDKVKRIVINRKTGEIMTSGFILEYKQLTKREKEVLLLIRQGFLSKEIAGKLNLSIHTVNNHRKNILAKLDVDNVIEALNILGNNRQLF